MYQLCLVSACSTCSISVVPSSVCGVLEFGFDNWFLDDLRQRNVEGMKGGGLTVFTLNQINPVLTVIFVSISYRSQIKLSLRL